MISASNLSKVFGNAIAVDRLTFNVARGEVVGLLGPNGAGKTTTVRMLACLISPTSGEASICGYSVGRDNSRIRQLVGVLTEAPGLYENLSARRNLEFYAKLYKVANPASAAEKYLRMLDLWERRDEKVGSFSKGMKQKLAIARALVHEPQVLFLDEPTSGLDPEMTKIVRNFIEELHRQGRSILICTHNLDEAERLCDRVAVIRSRLIALDSPERLRIDLFGSHTEIRLSRIDAALLSAVSSLPFVKRIETEDQKVIISLDQPERHNPMLVRELVNAGGEIISVQARSETLEDVYLKLIKEGRSE